jgi:hypothetical protein
MDATVQPKPIYISPNEVYAMHGLLSGHLDVLVSREDLHLCGSHPLSASLFRRLVVMIPSALLLWS